MNSERGYGADVELDGISGALEPTGTLRLALDVLRANLLPEMVTPTIEDALWDIHERLCAAELAALRTYGISQQYLIIRPINPANLPGCEDRDQITTAIRTLSGLGLIAGRGSDIQQADT